MGTDPQLPPTTENLRDTPTRYGARSGATELPVLEQGLCESLRGSGVSVHVVRPGFVMTKMTRGRPAALFAVEPDLVAAAVVHGLERGHRVVWIPKVLRMMFLFFQLLPHSVWRRLRG
jgi:short-subunit dehydrogenase